MLFAKVTEVALTVATAQPFLFCKRCCDFSAPASDQLTPLLPVVHAKAADFDVEVADALLPGVFCTVDIC